MALVRMRSVPLPARLAVVAALAVVALAPTAQAFSLHGEGATPMAVAASANRWALDARGGRGLPDGLAYSVEAGFCQALQEASSSGLCPDFIAVVHESFQAWASRNGAIRFTDVSGRVDARLDDGEKLVARGAEIDILVSTSDESPTLQARTRNLLDPDRQARLTNGDPARFDVIFSSDVTIAADPRCGQSGHIACWTPKTLREAITHELGHSLGLAHPFEGRNLALASDASCLRPFASVRDEPTQPASVMSYPAYGTFRGAPTDDDADGLAVLYPSCKAPSPPGRIEPVSSAAYRAQAVGPIVPAWGIALAVLAGGLAFAAPGLRRSWRHRHRAGLAAGPSREGDAAVGRATTSGRMTLPPGITTAMGRNAARPRPPRHP